MVEPIEKSVTREEFIRFLEKYPRELVRDVCGINEPPVVTYNDWKLANHWPGSVVATTYLYDDDPESYWYVPEEEREYKILVNHEEILASRIEGAMELESRYLYQTARAGGVKHHIVLIPDGAVNGCRESVKPERAPGESRADRRKREREERRKRKHERSEDFH